MKTILMNAGRTKDILDGRKTQTRRVIWDIPMGLHYGQQIMDYGLSNVYCDDFNGKELSYDVQTHIDDCGSYTARPKYQVGDILWVREPAKVVHYFLDSKNDYRRTIKYKYLADGKDNNTLVPPRFVTLVNGEFKNAKWIENCQGIPNGCIKEMARIFLKITNVRVERLQDMETSDMLKEGISEFKSYEEFRNAHSPHNPKDFIIARDKIVNDWIELWNKTAPKGFKWENNPYVFVYEFERVEKDQGEKL